MIATARILDEQGTVSFTAVYTEMSPASVNTHAGKKRPGMKTILLVEDEELLLNLLQMYLLAQGYEVITAQDGWEALGLFQQRKNEIDLIFFDQGLPGLDGISLFEETHKLSPGVRGICSTGYSDSALASRAHDAGVDAVLAKPYDWEQMTKTLQTVLKL